MTAKLDEIRPQVDDNEPAWRKIGQGYWLTADGRVVFATKDVVITPVQLWTRKNGQRVVEVIDSSGNYATRILAQVWLTEFGSGLPPWARTALLRLLRMDPLTTAELHTQICRMRDTGMTQQRIADIVGMRVGSVSWVLNNKGENTL
jgi:hypothetical protein